MFKNREPRFNIVWATFSWHQVHSRGDRLPEMAFRSVFKVWNGPAWPITKFLAAEFGTGFIWVASCRKPNYVTAFSGLFHCLRLQFGYYTAHLCSLVAPWQLPAPLLADHNL